MKDVVRTVRVPEHDDKLIEQLVKQGRFINKSDFLRQAVKKMLESEREEGAHLT